MNRTQPSKHAMIRTLKASAPFVIVSSIVPLLLTQSVFAAGAGAACSDKPTFLGLEPWYQYLGMQTDASGSCSTIAFPSTSTGALGANSPFLLIGLAVVDDLIRVAALVAVGYVIYGGIQYMTSGGSPDSTKKAQGTIINALVGLVIAILAASIVAFIGNRLGS
jgi:hypothetical protein